MVFDSSPITWLIIWSFRHKKNGLYSLPIKPIYLIGHIIKFR